jgi:hypothetical protein
MFASRNALVLSSVALVLLSAVSATNVIAEESARPTVDKRFLLEKEPKEASDVVAVRKDAKDKDQVMVVGRIGGRVNPWIKGAAAFSIVDRSRKPCNEIEGDTCETPWDYCCEADLPKYTLLVMIEDPKGGFVKKDARQLIGVKELDTVYVQGRAKRDKEGNITILATKLFVARDKKAAEKK